MSQANIPREFIQQLLSRVDIIDLIDHRVPLRKKSNNNYFACCPFHTEKSPSFSASQQKQFYYCFGCGAHGNAIDFLMQFDRLSFLEAIDILAKQVGVEVPRTAHGKKATTDPNLYDLLSRIAQHYQQELRNTPAAIQYLKKRGITGEIAKHFKLGFAPKSFEHILNHFGKTAELKNQLYETGMLIKKENNHYYDRFRERIMFPIQDRQGRVIGFGGRVLDQGEPKYLNSPETPLFQKGHELYGLYQVLETHSTLKSIVLVEGYMDVIGLYQHGVTHALATLGTATTSAHIKRLSRYTSNIVFCFDGDSAGRLAAWRALLVSLPLLQDDLQIKFMFLPEGEDPDSFIRKEGKPAFLERMHVAETFSQFFFHTLSAEVDLSTMDGRARLAHLATPHLKQIPEGVFQELMFAELAKIARIATAPSKPETKPQTVNPKRARVRAPSALRLAFTLLTQNPKLADCITEPLPVLETQGFALFAEMLHTIQEKSIQTTGILLEYFRDHPKIKWLVEFAETEHMIPTQGIEMEFMGTIGILKNMAKEQLIEHLLSKAAVSPLTSEEKKLLTQLIHSKKEDISL